MLTVDQALEAILERTQPLRSRSIPLGNAIGLRLDEDIVADLDLPPFDKALVDGYAMRSADLTESGEVRLRIVDEILAGRMPTRALAAGESAQIMTGAPLPSGADAVVMVERSRLDGDFVILEGPIKPGLNRLTRGREMRAGEILLPRGTRIDPVKAGLIASAGRTEVLAIPRPVVSVVPTGDEIVPSSEKPGPGQIRNSNGGMLTALVNASGVGLASETEIAPDDPAGLRSALGGELWMKEDGQRFSHSDPGVIDVLIVCGGVSAGTKDLVPATLMALGVEPVFHKVDVKPGKPLWFGVGTDLGYKPRILVFGLPGNPVSGIVGFLLFVKPALEVLAGGSPKRTQLASFRLGEAFRHRGDRPTYHPARLVDGRILPLEWAGSPDLRTAATADGFASFPAGDFDHPVGAEIPFLPLG